MAHLLDVVASLDAPIIITTTTMIPMITTIITTRVFARGVLKAETDSWERSFNGGGYGPYYPPPPYGYYGYYGRQPISSSTFHRGEGIVHK
ncbi:unnamed protein product [Heligmosomoides polygyrus]|uniref:Uncharacterized protein n=1 Tax=Heligmosomoides polygyrus TaxID=6339 RepID=A0A183FJ57_HELPZ|nr:unnamed protein product [Heligmosomoides polygyrus]